MIQQVGASISQAAADESFGMADVELGVVQMTGAGVTPWDKDSTTIDFSAGTLAGFMTTNGSTESCDPAGLALTVYPTASAAFVSGLYTNITGLPEHVALDVRGTFIFRHTTGSVSASLDLDGTRSWTQDSAGAGVASCDGNAKAAVDFKLSVLHTKSFLELDISAIASGRGVAPAFSIAGLQIKPVVLGEGEWTGRLHNFAAGIDSWIGTSITRSDCGASFGTVLGGPGVLGSNSNLAKTFTDIPAHTGLLVQLTFLFIGEWSGETAFLVADDVVVWSQAFSSVGVTENDCGVKTAASRITVTLDQHTASRLALRVSTSLRKSADVASFAIQNVLVAHPSSILGTGLGPFVPGPVNFSTGLNDWRAFEGKLDFCVQQDTKQNVSVLVSSSPSLAVVEKTVYNLTAHNAVEVLLKLWFRHNSGQQRVTINMDNNLVWSDQRTADAAPACGAAADFEKIFVVLAHDSDTISVVIEALMVDGQGQAGIAVADVEIRPVLLGSAPWRPQVTTFADSLDGWLGPSLAITECPPVGSILGGHGVLGASAQLINRITNLPKHNGLIIRLRFLHFGCA